MIWVEENNQISCVIDGYRFSVATGGTLFRAFVFRLDYTNLSGMHYISSDCSTLLNYYDDAFNKECLCATIEEAKTRCERYHKLLVLK